jgi:hypothetical protein
MNTLWIFGDSFSWDYKLRQKNNPEGLLDDSGWNYIQTHLKGKIFDSWGEQLSNNLGYEYINHGCYQSGIEIPNLEAGNSNDCNINLINELSSEFKKGDIVIFGFTDPIRFPWPNKENIDQVSILTSSDIQADEFERKVVEEIVIRRDSPFFVYSTIQKLKSIETLSNLVGFDLWYWDWSSVFDKYVIEKKLPNDRWIFHHAHPNYIDYGKMIWEDYKAGPICWETNYTNPDSHFGKIGHTIHADVLTKFLKK